MTKLTITQGMEQKKHSITVDEIVLTVDPDGTAKLRLSKNMTEELSMRIGKDEQTFTLGLKLSAPVDLDITVGTTPPP